MQISILHEQLQYFKQVAQWHQEEWAHLNDGETLQEREVRMKNTFLNAEIMDTMFIGSVNGELIGTAAIIQSDMDTKPQLAPWLASVYVDVEKRGKGYGALLVKHAMNEAKQMGIYKLYLYTPDQSDFYKRLGWDIVSEEIYHNESVTIMEWKP